MKIKISVPEGSIKNEYQYMTTIKGHDENLEFPLFTIGRDSYLIESCIEINADSDLVCNVHIGRYSSVARNTIFMMDQNHDYRRVCQGRISGVEYKRPEFIRRKGQIVIMNDCWIGEDSMILSGVTIGNGCVIGAGSVVTHDIPDNYLAYGNPCKAVREITKEDSIYNKKELW